MKGNIQTKLNPGERHYIHEKSLFTDHYEETKKKVQLMGILNCTPDSFHDGGKFLDPDKAVVHGLQLEAEGADILDIGGQSTRPSASRLNAEEEMARVLPVIKTLVQSCRIPLSIDTFHPEVAKAALELGVSLINDVTGFASPRMREVAKEFQVPICVMHMLGEPQTMQNNPHYPLGVVKELCLWFEKRVQELIRFGIKEDLIILDPGIGFGKTVSDNVAIIQKLRELTQLGFPISIGLSRKSFQSKILKKTTTDLLSTTLALNTMSILEGAHMIRVHDVKEHREVIDMLTFFKK